MSGDSADGTAPPPPAERGEGARALRAGRGGNRVWFAAAAAAISALVFSGIAGHDFTFWDDHIHIFQNPYVCPPSAAGLWHLWSHPYRGLYIPVSYMAYAALCAIARLPAASPQLTNTGAMVNPHVFHAASILVHAANAALVFLLLNRLVRKSWPALAGALLFALHPVQVESVAWASELRGLLCAFFSIGAMLLYVRSERGLANAEAAGAKAQRAFGPAYWSAMACLIVALLCKPSAVTVPFVLVGIAMFSLKMGFGAAMRSTGLFFVPAVLATVLTHGVQSVPPEVVVPLWARPLVASDALWFYLGKLVWPVHLGFDYGRRPMDVLASRWAFVELLAPVALVALAWACRRSAALATLAVVLFIANVLPVLGLVPFHFQFYSTVADRYLYLAMLGPALAGAWLLSRSRGWHWYALAALCLAGCVVGTERQIPTWTDNVTLMSHDLTVNPSSFVARNNLGVFWATHGDMARARALFNDAVALNPNYADARFNRAKIEVAAGDLAGARADLEAAARLDPADTRAALILQRLGSVTSAPAPSAGR